MRKRNSKFEWQDAFANSGLTGNTGFIGLLMSLKDNGDGRGFFISHNTISELTGLSTRAVGENVSKLKETGWIKVTKRGGNQGGVPRANWYELTYPKESQPADMRSQPEAKESSQPADMRSQPEAGCYLVNPTSLDPLLVDQDKGVTGSMERQPNPSQRDMLMPTSKRLTLSTSEARQRDSHARANRAEGLDENGEPLQRENDSPRIRRSFRGN